MTPTNCFERYGCIVETAHAGDEAVLMVRNCSPSEPYDVIISDIRLPDYSGHQLMLRLQAILPQVPMVLMTGLVRSRPFDCQGAAGRTPSQGHSL